MAARIGDVVAASTGNWGVVATKAEPLEASLIGMHGSLTAAEQLVPMLPLPPGERARPHRGARAQARCHRAC